MKTKKIYCKPSVQYVEIAMNDLCAGSVCTKVDLNAVKIQKMNKKSKTTVLKDGASSGMWDTTF